MAIILVQAVGVCVVRNLFFIFNDDLPITLSAYLPTSPRMLTAGMATPSTQKDTVINNQCRIHHLEHSIYTTNIIFFIGWYVSIYF